MESNQNMSSENPVFVKEKIGFSKEDCLNLIQLYLPKRTSKASWYLIQGHIDPASLMQAELNVSFGRYQVEKSLSSAPTQKQLKDDHDKVKKSADRLLKHLANLTDFHFMEAIASAKTGAQSPVFIDNKEFTQVYDNIRSLGDSLKWLTNALEPCLKNDFIYEYKKPDGSKTPETVFIRAMSDTLAKHFEEKKGYGRGNHSDQNSAMGWRIDCLEYLLNCVGVSKTRNQILDSIT